ncbi:hypothetical protein SLS54_000991 [Diplodia seriata]
MDMSRSPRYVAWLALSFLCGILTHHSLFRRVELDRYPVQVASTFVALYFVLAKSLHSSPYGDSCYSASFAVIVTFISGLCLSTFVHRALFHPLNRFPGPFSARLSKFWATFQTAKTRGQWYKFNRQLHAEYGDYIRIGTSYQLSKMVHASKTHPSLGPRDLSITDPDAIIPILGPSAKTSKGPFYGALEQSVHTTLDKEFHRQRRRVWDNGFKVRFSGAQAYDILLRAVQVALEGFAPRVEAITDDLLWVLARHSHSGTPVPFNEMAQRFSFDIMCALAFGEPAGYLTGKTTVDDESIFKSMYDSLDVIGDTAAGALTIIFAYLATHQEHLSRLRAEVIPALAPGGAYTCLRPTLPFLDATINECLRLHPPISWASSRVTGPSGLHIPRTTMSADEAGQPGTNSTTTSSTYIPPNTIVSIPPCGIMRDPRNFVDPDAFRPERWTTEPRLIKRREAFIPFLTGPYQCPGKGLAMMELRSAVARTVAQFDVVWMDEEGKDLAAWSDRIKDHFTMGLPGLKLGFRELELEREA